jgi:UDP-4-amino-4,6-dideoxy-N-acetyl-beta-L-altrosamine N-acetyltransferase
VLLRGPRSTLRPIEQTDQILVASWRNQPHIVRGLFSHHAPSLVEQQRWFADYLDREDEKLFIIETEQQTPIGTVGLSKIDLANRRAEYGRMLIGNRDYLRRGYAAEATLTLLNYAFDELQLHRVYLKVLADNDAAVRLYHHCHFRLERRFRNAHFAEERFHDVLLMAILSQQHLVATKPGPQPDGA